MQTIMKSYRGLSVVIDLNLDRLIIPAAIIVGLVGGAMIGAELFNLQAPVINTLP